MMLMLLVEDSVFDNRWFGRWEEGNEICIHNGVSRFAVRNSILFWLYILIPCVLCSLFSEAAASSQQVTNFITLLSLNFPRDG